MDVVLAMGIAALQGQLAFVIGRTGSQQRICHEHSAGKREVFGRIQPENKSLSGLVSQNLRYRSIGMRFCLQNLFFFVQGDFRRQKIIADRKGSCDNRRLAIRTGKLHLMAGGIQNISFWSSRFYQVIFTQRQRLGSHGSLCRCDKRICQFAFLIPDSAVFSCDDFSRANLKNRSGQTAFFIDRLLYFMTIGVRPRFKPGQLQAFLFHKNFSPDRRIGNFNRHLVAFASCISRVPKENLHSF